MNSLFRIKYGVMDFLTVLVFIFSGMYLVQAASNPELCKDAKPHEVTLFKLTKAKTLEFQIAESLDGAGGQAGRGLEIVIDPKRGNCLSCHQISSVEKLVDIDKPESKINYGYHGTIANSLDGVADKYTAGELRLIVVDPKRAFPNQDSIMPSYHRIDGFINVDPSCKGKSILSAQDVEDVVAFLLQLKSDKPAVPGN